ncbi:hypothetical protein FGB62_54g127 [Gracilaria domingensis]|nr:hypothetical protein FGB62_54g127 [Gracilaria domingensis]
MFHGLRSTDLIMEDQAVQEVPTTMPEDVVQGALLALRCLTKDEIVLSIVRMVRLSAMSHTKLQTALKRLSCCSGLEELHFVDAKDGVKLPKAVACQVQVLSILSPRALTLKNLVQVGCAPKKLQLYCVDYDTALALHGAWKGWTHRCKNVDITWSGSLLPKYEHIDAWYESIDCDCCYYLVGDDDDEHVEDVRYESEHRYWSLGSQFAMRLMPKSDVEEIEGHYGWKPVFLRDWLRNQQTHQEEQPIVDRLAEEGCLTVVVSPEEDYILGAALLKQFVRDILFRDEQRVQRLHVAVPLEEETQPVAANVAARLVHEAASAGVQELIVSSLVFMELADKPLPATVTSIGVVDDFVPREFVYQLPMTLAMLAADPRIVWMQNFPLREDGSDWEKKEWLETVEDSCRNAERRGVLAMGGGAACWSGGCVRRKIRV